LNPDASVNETVRLFIPDCKEFKTGGNPVTNGFPAEESDATFPA
jgi:hypothetical protein